MQKNIIKVPFQGHCVDIIREGQTVGHYSGKSFEQLSAESKSVLKLVDDAEYDRFHHEYMASLCTKPSEITKERFWELLECLPPCRWSNYGVYEMFHISERLQGNLVTWCAKDKINNKYYELDQQADIELHNLKAILDEVK